MLKKYGCYIVWILAFLAISTFIGLQHKPMLMDWYKFLNKSWLTPPGYVFSIVWPLLYTCLAIVGCMMWGNRKVSHESKLIFAVQMLLNWSWTTLFFSYHYILVSGLVIAVMIALTLWLMKYLHARISQATYLLFPYISWLCFALYLNTYIWLFN